MTYVSSEYKKDAFNCPRCGAYAQQHWEKETESLGSYIINIGMVAICDRCKKFSIWVDEKMVYPLVNGTPIPHPEMPDDIKGEYEEARSIVSRSPRSAAALLRLAIEKLTNLLLGNEKGKDLNDNIAILVQKGLPEKIQKALDYLRVIGNNAVHPLGKIDLQDNKQVANSLFDILNMIVDDMISETRRIDKVYDTLPEKYKSNIEKRDSKEPPK